MSSQSVLSAEPAPKRLSRRTAALIGVLAVGAALAVGDLVAALVNPDSSPLLAVGNRVVDFASQGSIKEFAISLMGDYDKLALVGGMGVVVFLVAVIAGLLSRSDALPGVVAAVVIGALGVLAVLFSPVLAPLDLLAPLASVLVGAGAFFWLHTKASAMSTAPSGADHAVLFLGGIGVFVVDVTKTLIGQPHMSQAVATALIIAGLVVAVLALGYVLLRVLRGRASTSDEAADDQEPSTEDEGAEKVTARRPFLLASAGAAAGAAVVGFGGYSFSGTAGAAQSRQALMGKIKPAEKAPPIPADAAFTQDGTPSFLTKNSEFYRVDTALRVPQIATQDWALRIHGMVEKELNFTFDDIRSRRLVERTITMTCVSNQVGGRYVSTANFVGVPMRELLLEAGVHESADQLFSTSYDGYTAGTPVDVLLDKDRGAMLAIAMNGEPLPMEHGFPVRMVTPGLYGYLSATKWVIDMELTTFDAKQGYWIPKGYSLKAPIKTQSRIDRPDPFQKVEKGKVTVAGIAWSQPRGISKVEVRMDEGKWQQADLATEVNGSTWRMWRTEFSVSDTGFHSIECRATDVDGRVQTDVDKDALPNGATGWPSIQFSTV